jgi:hypothetical protein
LARTPRTFSRRGHAEAKAGENIGQAKPREHVTENAKQTDQQKQISEVSLTRSPSRLGGVFRLLPRLRRTRFRGCGLRDGRTWRERVFSFKHRRRNETKEYHRAQQSPHENDWLPGNENLHCRTSRDEERLTIPLLYCEKAQTFHEHLASVSSLRSSRRAKNSNAWKDVLPRPRKCLVQIVLHPGMSAFSKGSRNS